MREFGLGGGLAGYTGELGANPLSNAGYDMGLFFRANLNQRMSLRLSVDYGHVKGKKPKNFKSLPDAEGLYDFDFENNFLDFEILMDINFFPYPFQIDIWRSSDITPFYFAGVGILAHKPVADSSEKTDNTGFMATPTIPFGVGVRYLLGKHLGLQFQFKAMKLFTDDFDTKRLNNPLNFQNQGTHTQDWLFSSTLMLTYSMGEALWDCNCPKEERRARRRARR